MKYWIQPYGGTAWHLFREHAPAALCGERFAMIDAGPLTILPDGEAGCSECRIRAAEEAYVTSASTDPVELAQENATLRAKIARLESTWECHECGHQNDPNVCTCCTSNRPVAGADLN